MRVEEIKAAIEALPGAEFVEIRKWVADRDWQIWDREVQADSKAGRLDSGGTMDKTLFVRLHSKPQ